MRSGRGFSIDDSELRTLQVDISEAPMRLQRNSRKAMAESARLVDREMRVDAFEARRRIPTSIPNLAEAVTHSVYGPWDAEIGLEPGKGQGSIAHIIVYGSVNNAPVYDHTAGLRRAEPRVLEIFANAAEDAALGKDRDQ